MTVRPRVLLSCAVSVDGYIDDLSPRRLVLSGPEDLDRVDQVRSESDAILVGGTTVRRDDPRLLVASARRRRDRQSRGLPAHPLKVTVTASGDLDPSLRFWHVGGGKLVYCPSSVADRVRARLGALAEVVPLGGRVEVPDMLRDLRDRGVERLLVEGGGRVHTQFLTAGVVDEIQLAVAPFFVGEPGAPRFVGPGRFPADASHRMTVAEVRAVGDMALVRYLPPDTSATDSTDSS